MSTKIPSISFDPPHGCVVGSLWRRILAFVVDGLMLYAAGRIVGAAFFNTLSRLGQWALLLGFSLALAYFGTLESYVGGGQTLGKRLLQLKIVNPQGKLIPWERAAARYTIFAVPYFLIDPSLTAVRTTWIIPFLIIFTTLGVGGSTLYLLVFNRRTRQGLHDLVVGTYVVNSRVSGPLRTEPIWGIHRRVIGGFLFLVALTALSKGISLESEQRTGYASQKLKDERLIEELRGVEKAEVRIWTPIPMGNTALGSFLPKKKPATIIIQRTGEAGASEPFADQAAGIILKYDPRAQKEDWIEVEVGRSYSLGFASGNDYQTFTHTREEWTQRVFGSSPASNTPLAHQ